MIENLVLDTRKDYAGGYNLHISPLRRGERNNVMLIVSVLRDRTPYDLTGMTAHLVWQAADGKLVGPVPMEVADPDAGTVRCTLPDACYSAVGMARAYIEIRDGAELVDTTDEMLVDVLDCIDADAEQAEEYKPLIAEVRDATDAAVKAAERAESGEDERTATEVERVSAESARKQAETEREQGWADLKADAEKTVGDAVKRADSAADRATQAAASADAAGDAATAAAAKAKADTKAAVDSANASVSKAVADAKADVDVAVGRSDAATAKAEEAVETANDANTAATKAVTDAQAAIAEVKATEAKLYPAAENVLKGTAKDTFVHVDDASSGAALREITVEGACKQDGTPSPDNPVTIQVIENPVLKVTGRNLANPSEAYYQNSKIKAEQIADGFRFVITSNDTRILYIPCEVKKGDTIVASFDEKNLSGTVANLSIYFPEIDVYFRKDKPHVMEEDAHIVGIYVDLGNVGEYDVTNFRVSRNVDDGYKPYTSQSLAFTLPAEHPYLAKLPGLADTIEVDKDGNVELVARAFMNRNVRKVGDFKQGKYYSLEVGAKPFANQNEDCSGMVLCSALPSRETTSNYEGIYRTWNGVYVSDTSGRTKEEIQAEVDKNAPLTVVARIPDTRYPLGKIEMPKAQDSIVNVWTDAEVTPSTGIEYARDVNIVVANLESAIASITEG